MLNRNDVLHFIPMALAIASACGPPPAVQLEVDNLGPIEECDNLIDDDNDQSVDCSDSSCAWDASCECVDLFLGTTLGEAARISIEDYVDDYPTSSDPSTCGGAAESGPDAVAVWTAPEDSCYNVFVNGWWGTEEPEFDAILRHLSSCEGKELACGRRQLLFEGEVGAPHTFVVDGVESNAHGFVQLHIERWPTKLFDLGTATGARVADERIVPTAVVDGGSCVERLADAAYFLWTAPATTTYVLDTAGSSFDTGLVVHEGSGGASGCPEIEVACNDDGPNGDTSSVRIDAVEGEEYVVVIGVAGELNDPETLRYVLNVHQQ